MATNKTFYIETFGCQMNVHDSEKVIGTLRHEGYAQVDTEADADLILYNTCSIRDKAEQKVFNRLNDYKKLHASGKRFVVLGCVAQQEGERIFERAPYVSLVSGSASYRKLPEMLVRLEAGESRITGLDDRQTEETFETEFTARTNRHRGYITIIEGCDKFCAYCVVPYTRGKERSRTSTSVLAEAHKMAEAGYTEIQLLGQNVNSYRDREGKRSFAELLAAVGEMRGFAGCALPLPIRATPRRISLPRSMQCLHCAITFIFRCRAARRGCWLRCSGSTAATNTWNGSRGSERPGAPSALLRI